MITFEEARERATASLAPSWNLGTFMVAEYGFEDADDFLLITGAREAILGDELAFIEFSGLVTIVNKETGDVDRLIYLDDLERYEAMTSCGRVSAELD